MARFAQILAGLALLPLLKCSKNGMIYLFENIIAFELCKMAHKTLTFYHNKMDLSFGINYQCRLNLYSNQASDCEFV